MIVMIESELFQDAQDWEEMVKKKLEKLSCEKDREIRGQWQKIKHLEEEVCSKQKEIEGLIDQLKRAEERFGEISIDNRQLRKRLEDAELKICLERRNSACELEDNMAMKKKKHDTFVMELREKVKIEEMERDRVRRDLKKRREEEREYLEFLKFKKRRRSK